MTRFANGGRIITPDLIRKLNASEPPESGNDSDLVPALLSPGCAYIVITAADDNEPGTWECGFCERGQCARCSDPRCTCCNGNPDARPV